MLNQEDDIQHSRQTRSAGSKASQRATETLGIVEYALMGIIPFLFLLIIFVMVTLVMPRILPGSSYSFNTQNLKWLLFLMLIYAACIGVGYFVRWYQSKNATIKELERFEQVNSGQKKEIARLQRENAILQNQLRAAQPATPALSLAPAGNPVTQPRAIEQVQPPPSIYDNPREPDDPSDLIDHPHEKIFPATQEVNSLGHGWYIIGASRRGYGHAYEGKYREDDFNVRIFGARGTKRDQHRDIALIAIADGVSSKTLSRRGARAAVLGATGISEQRLGILRSMLGKNTLYKQCQGETYYILMDSLQAAHDQVEQCAYSNGVTIDELQSTLLTFLVAPWDERQLLVASTQIGDGALFVLQPNKGPAPQYNWNWLQQPQIGGAGNEVQPFMRTGRDDWHRFFQCDLIDDADCIMGMTDGTADDIEPPRATPENPKPDPFSLVDDFYQRIIVKSLMHTQPAKQLAYELRYRKKQSHDDRTVVCVYRS